MVVNNMLIKLKNRDAESVQAAVTILRGLAGNIPCLLDSRVETELRAGQGSYDIMLINTFGTNDDVKTYIDHPVHVEISKQIVEMIESSAALRYEV